MKPFNVHSRGPRYINVMSGTLASDTFCTATRDSHHHTKYNITHIHS